MANTLTGKIAIVIGGAGILAKDIVKTFLAENATVVVPAISSNEVMKIKQHVSALASGKLITLLTDLPDYSKAFDIVTDIKEEFGQIDLAVVAIDNCCSQHALSKTDIKDWERMIEQQITPFFISTKLMLSFLEDASSLYVTINDQRQLSGNNKNVLGHISASMQEKIAGLIASEIPGIKPRYHHFTIDQQFSEPERVGTEIVQLYLEQGILP